jgi:hypothetical protein
VPLFLTEKVKHGLWPNKHNICLNLGECNFEDLWFSNLWKSYLHWRGSNTIRNQRLNMNNEYVPLKQSTIPLIPNSWCCFKTLEIFTKFLTISKTLDQSECLQNAFFGVFEISSSSYYFYTSCNERHFSENKRQIVQRNRSRRPRKYFRMSFNFDWVFMLEKYRMKISSDWSCGGQTNEDQVLLISYGNQMNSLWIRSITVWLTVCAAVNRLKTEGVIKRFCTGYVGIVYRVHRIWQRYKI